MRNRQKLAQRKHAIYYALAIAEYLEDNPECLAEDVINSYTYVDFMGSRQKLLTNRDIFREALSILSVTSVIELDEDEHAPTIITLKRDFSSLIQKNPSSAFLFFSPDEQAILKRFVKAGERQKDWIIGALKNLPPLTVATEEKEENNLADDNKNSESGWEPIPLDRDSSELRTVIQEIEKTADTVRSDNGYVSNHPHETKYVVDHLALAVKSLKEDAEISWMYLKEFVLAPLNIVIKRMGKAATGIVAASARAALTDWLKKHGFDLFN
jgi:hypothetical protein